MWEILLGQKCLRLPLDWKIFVAMKHSLLEQVKRTCRHNQYTKTFFNSMQRSTFSIKHTKQSHIIICVVALARGPLGLKNTAQRWKGTSHYIDIYNKGKYIRGNILQNNLNKERIILQSWHLEEQPRKQEPTKKKSKTTPQQPIKTKPRNLNKNI